MKHLLKFSMFVGKLIGFAGFSLVSLSIVFDMLARGMPPSFGYLQWLGILSGIGLVILGWTIDNMLYFQKQEIEAKEREIEAKQKEVENYLEMIDGYLKLIDAYEEKMGKKVV